VFDLYRIRCSRWSGFYIIGINFLKLANLAVEGIGSAIAINDVRNHINKKQQMSDVELTQAIAREEKKLDERDSLIMK
jgi:hypothetical protein